jgi:hypothetical protein
MIKYLLSFASGFLFKTYLAKIALKFIKVLLFFKPVDGEYKFMVVCKVNKPPPKNETFWEYFSNKKVIKFQIFDDSDFFIKNREVEVQEIYDWTGVNLEYFKKAGDVYLYVYYPGGINVYSDSDTITPIDFDTTNNRFKDVVCCSVSSPGSENRYITNYLKLYGNNKKLTPELILLNYDNFDEPLIDTNIKIINSKECKEYQINEQI